MENPDELKMDDLRISFSSPLTKEEVALYIEAANLERDGKISKGK
jgi:hypothetical protein